ncbi:hypothetical protein BGZ49_007275 [Haplosporangium sp. Z 27]|nr:hypothetical protein BGZ49_007275 [Haplosporangium sp. Z 27]
MPWHYYQQRFFLYSHLTMNNHYNSVNNKAVNHQGSDPSKHEKDEFHILPIDEDKKYPPPPKDRHGHTGPFMMPGPFISSKGANATAFERELSKNKKEESV